MRQFCKAITVVLFVVGLVMVAGCGNNMQSRVLEERTTADYSYTISEVKDGRWWSADYEGKYAYEFLGGTPEQRKALETMPFHAHGKFKYRHQAEVAICFNIQTWQEIQPKQQAQ